MQAAVTSDTGLSVLAPRWGLILWKEGFPWSSGLNVGWYVLWTVLPPPPPGGNRPPKEGRMPQNNLFHCIHTENIIDLLLGSRNNGYKLVYGGFGEVFVIPQRTAVVFKFICENRSIKNGFSSWPTTEGGKKESFSKPKKKSTVLRISHLI